MELIVILIFIFIGVVLFDSTRKEFKKLKNKVRRFFRGSEQTYVSPHKRTITVKGHSRNKPRQKKR